MNTPADHYAAAGAILAEINKTSEEAKPRIEGMLADGAYEQAREAADVMAQMVGLGLAQAQVHATLATVDPDVLWPARKSSPWGCKRGCGPDIQNPACPDHGACICSTLAHEPLAKTAMHPDCPIHGEKG